MPSTRAQVSHSQSSKGKKEASGGPRVKGGTVVHGGAAGKKGKLRKGGRKKRGSKYTAATADRYELYQLAVQSADVDAEFLADTYKKERRRKARHLREDFCGTALLCSYWVRLNKRNTAEGFDNDPEPVTWGIENNLAPLGSQTSGRVSLHVEDVRAPGDQPPDVRCAQNFSYCIFKARAELLEYFRIALRDLADKGIFVLDLHGGPESTEEMEEEKKIEGGFTYVWDQGEYFPVTGEQSCAIHFEFRDGSKMREAFTYSWRVWSMPELVDLLYEAGFEQVDCYFEGDEEDSDEGNGIFEKDPKGENCPSWIAYIVALK